MPQVDRHRQRQIPIEFNFYDPLASLPYENRLTMVLISDGSVNLNMNQQILTLKAPALLCISKYDKITQLSSHQLSAKTFSFDPWYIKGSLTFDNLDDQELVEDSQEHNRQILQLFVDHTSNFQGVFELSPGNYLRLNEILSFIGAETYSQSDKYWTCRIRRLLLQALNTIFDIYVDQRKLHFYDKPESSVVNLCTQYIHINYGRDIALKDLCELVNLNRTSLNQHFKDQLQMTAMDYLMIYRMDTAKELLTNTNLKISEISTTCGFKYDTYFIKQFTKKTGQSPTQFRKYIWSQK